MSTHIQPPPIPKKVFSDCDIETWLNELEQRSKELEEYERAERYKAYLLLREILD